MAVRVKTHLRVESKSRLTQDVLRSLISYNPDTGICHWLVDKAKHGKWGRKGTVAGCASKGAAYQIICINGVRYRAHRLIWLYVYGRWPANEIDHVDLDKRNNRLSNLRESNEYENQANKGLKSSNKTGCTGVYFDKARGLWAVQITKEHKRHCLGRFASFEDAKSVRQVAEQRIFGEFARSAA